MSFQILDKNNNPISLEKLDEEAAAFFGVEINNEKYAKPSKDASDWFNTVGYAIDRIGNPYNREWTSVVGNILKVTATLTTSYDNLQRSIEVYRPFIELCYHWKEKGYIPQYC